MFYGLLFPVVVFLDFEVAVVFVAYWFMGCRVLLFCWLRWWFVGLLGWVFWSLAISFAWMLVLGCSFTLCVSYCWDCVLCDYLTVCL